MTDHLEQRANEAMNIQCQGVSDDCEECGSQQECGAYLSHQRELYENGRED